MMRRKLSIPVTSYVGTWFYGTRLRLVTLQKPLFLQGQTPNQLVNFHNGDDGKGETKRCQEVTQG